MKRTVILCAVTSLVFLYGCGGGGNSGSTTASGGTGRAAVLLTDSFREDFGHVWATIYHVELTPQGGGAAVVLFDDPNGHQIDLRTLRDASGNRYSFLGNSTIPAGTYTGLEVTVGPTMQLFRAGVAVGNPIPVDSSIPKDSAGHPELTLTFKAPKTLGSGTNNLIIDFDLAHFIVRDSGILPAIAEGTGDGLGNPSQHEPDEYHGTVSQLSGTAPTLTFTLNRGNGQTTTVVTTASTALYGSATLTNSANVEVTGTLDPTTQQVVATSIEIESAAEAPRPCIMGTATNIDATAGTFQLTVHQIRGFMPGQTTINVVTNASTAYVADSGATETAADFFNALATTPTVQVKGTFDASTNTLTATTARVDDHSKDNGWEQAPHPFRGQPDQWGNGHVPGGPHGDH